MLGHFCTSCGDECDIIHVDFGYGDYEYWGARGTHSDKQPVSDCCENEVECRYEDNSEEGYYSIPYED